MPPSIITTWPGAISSAPFFATLIFESMRSDGEWQRQNREVYDRGNGATILLYNRQQRTVVLTRQFRFPTYVNGYHDFLIETAAGLLDNLDPESRIRAEAEEETGYRITNVQKVFEASMSPSSVTEKLFFFTVFDAPPSNTESPTFTITVDEPAWWHAIELLQRGRHLSFYYFLLRIYII